MKKTEKELDSAHENVRLRYREREEREREQNRHVFRSTTLPEL